jgi:hydrogenase maturation protease
MAMRDGRVGEDRDTVVIGIGNVLTGDDAFGPTVVKTLEAVWALPSGVEALDAGTPGMDLVALAAGASRVIVVDTVLSAGPPGTLRVYDRDQLLAKPLTPRVNPHAPGLVESLFTLDLSGDGPTDVLLVGVVPGPTDVGVGMSAEVVAAVPRVVDVIVAALRDWGLRPRRRAEPLEADLWWEVAARGAFIPGSARSIRATGRTMGPTSIHVAARND